MKCTIMHETRGRIRVKMAQSRMTLAQADILEYYLLSIPGITEVKVNDRTCCATVLYACPRQNVLDALAKFTYEANTALVPEHTGRALNREFEDELVLKVVRRGLMKLFVPAPIRKIITFIRSFKYIRRAWDSIRQGQLDIAVLDATSIVVSLIRGDWQSANSIMFLLNFSEHLEEWTRKKTVDDLARTMSLNIDRVWLKTGDTEVEVPIENVKKGDLVIVRTGNLIPLDGYVHSGEAMVNQASMTGESVPVRKESGSSVFAGTVIEEGEIVIEVSKVSGSGRYDRIVNMIEESEKLKSAAESKASNLADNLVPYTLAGTILTYLITRNATRAISILMVDFSCALKLAMPVAVLSAMREGRMNNISAKGGKYLEAVAQADTIVFDKTGTLTYACPTVIEVVPFGGHDENEMLRLAACLEEHYPHSMANAVINEAVRRGLHHEECHSWVEYIVAHGIASTVNEEKVVIGSHHFVFQDEGCVVADEDRAAYDAIRDDCSHLYMAISGKLAAVICIWDPFRYEAVEVVKQLHNLGIKRVVIMTGDNKKIARRIATAIGVDEFYAEVLPDDKASFIRAEREAGRKVIMIGDGINDSLALAEADVGVAIAHSSAIAREVADITLTAEDLYALVTLRRLSTALMDRIGRNYRFIMGFNSMLILLGVLGILPPATSALLHNASTLAVTVHSMTNMLE
ncbi:MAG: cadmium-translocating P-type ATPase [Oscillospiraceae bacterium]|nr:cadmium-translocating P-type ATPase [Oscillospiraceae bacterium]